MKIRFSKEKLQDPEKLIRRCGYGKILDRRTGQTSYARRLRGSLYPRFHVYIDDKDKEFVFNIHLDQRQTRYKGVTAHAGEYDGELVTKEADLIKRFLSVV